MATLSLIALPFSELASKRAKEEELRLALRTIRAALDQYKQAVDDGKIVRSEGSSGYPPNLGVLTSGVINAKSPRGEKIYFLRRIPADPFSKSDMPAEKTWGLRSYSSPPDDPREGVDVYDVFSKSSDIGLNGIPYQRW